jgi:glycerol kinase
MTDIQNKNYIIALDQGTTSSRAIIFDRDANVVCTAQREFAQHYPQAGWVEHDPMEIFATQSAVMVEALAQAGLHHDQVAAIGITNQRETTVVWDKTTGRPVYNAIVWQCRRSTEICQQLKRDGHEDYIRDNTGLVTDPYFSGTKLKWILDNVEGSRERARNGELLFGTVDSWLIWKFTGGKVHVTDYTNASRTMLFNIHSLEWDSKMLEILDIPREMLPEVKASSEIYGRTKSGIAIGGIAGDQQAALFGQMCVEPGQAKNTYGTGCFLLMNTGDKAVKSQHGMLTTIACGPRGEVAYALEGAVFNGGSTVQWLRDELKIINDAHDTEYFANKVKDSNGVYLVPAFTGLGAPHWDANARGAMFGLTRNTGPREFARAALDSVCFQTLDLLEAMRSDWPEADGAETVLRVDGGMVASDWTMQRLADILAAPVDRPQVLETTALGAAYLAGLDAGLLPEPTQFADRWRLERRFSPGLAEETRRNHVAGWRDAVRRTLSSS